jgi:hypothetical protein
MVVLDPHSDAEVSQCQQQLRDQVANEKLILGLVRGSTNDELAKKFDEQSQNQPWRTAVWVKNAQCFDPGQESTWFGDDSTDVGCTLTFARTPSVRLHADAMTFDVEVAYAQAESGGEL